MFMQEKGVKQKKIPEQKIYLVRHARPELPHGGGVYYGRTDYPLSQEGIESAKALGAALSGQKFDHIYTSPLARARHTARIIAPGRSKEMHVSKNLQEISLGEWEGKTYDEVRDQWNEIYEKRGLSFAVVSPPGGECFADVQKRAVPAL
jgi:broad specificity phosphatase PhoE